MPSGAFTRGGVRARISGIQHVQLAMPHGEEEKARAFYVRLLGLVEVPKPPNFAARGGCWFELDSVRVHLGVEKDFRPARKAHPAFTVASISELRSRLQEGGFEVADDEPLAGWDRFYGYDPFGNRIEFMECKGD